MINRDEATLAMINVSKGIASEEEKILVETMDERLFSDIYNELQGLVTDSNYSIEEYYEVESDEETSVKDTTKLKWGLDSDKEDDDYETEPSQEELIKSEFVTFYAEFSDDYETEDEAYKDFVENYCSYTTDSNYSWDENSAELEAYIVDEFSEFLVAYGNDYESSDEAYDDYIRNYCNYL